MGVALLENVINSWLGELGDHRVPLENHFHQTQHELLSFPR